MINKLRSLLVGIYTWTTAVLFGVILLDVVYAISSKNVLDYSESAMVFSGVSDTLLRMGFFLVIAAIGAIVSAWEYIAARSLLIASLIIFFYFNC